MGDRKKSSSAMQPVYKYRSLGLFREQKKLLIEESYCLQSEAPLFLSALQGLGRPDNAAHS